MSAPNFYDWLDAKHRSNLAKHGLGFDEALAVFLDDRRIDFDVSRPQDGEERRNAVGRIDCRLVTVVYTRRGEVCWIISARRANRPEERCYVQR
jgi:uncharacterized DUF497 family protein